MVEHLFAYAFHNLISTGHELAATYFHQLKDDDSQPHDISYYQDTFFVDLM